jgi:hypothetical protein
MKGGGCSPSELLSQNQPGESDENHENLKLASKKNVNVSTGSYYSLYSDMLHSLN